ncbi:Uncharacterized protein Fot_53874 [Forsythia ovata]|uniref:Uncharacterized protein n=1 Tax=Forsythia ovata TaxID=205694 RepID=A0ABD1PG58_9LAMI
MVAAYHDSTRTSHLVDLGAHLRWDRDKNVTLNGGLILCCPPLLQYPQLATFYSMFGTGTGTALHGSDLSKQLEDLKRKARAERFGTGNALHGSDLSKQSEDLKKKARVESRCACLTFYGCSPLKNIVLLIDDLEFGRKHDNNKKDNYQKHFYGDTKIWNK